MKVGYCEMSAALRWVSNPGISRNASNPSRYPSSSQSSKILQKSCQKKKKIPQKKPLKQNKKDKNPEIRPPPKKNPAKKNPTQTRPPSPAQRTPLNPPPPSTPPRARRDFGIRKDMQYSLPDRFPRLDVWDFCSFCVCSPCPWCRFPACIP